MAPSQVQIATGVLQRLVKEEQSYYKEMDQQKARISKLEKGEGDDAENMDFQLRQEVGTTVHVFFGSWSIDQRMKELTTL